MTILIGYKLSDRVILASDRLRVKIDDSGKVLAPKNNAADKIRIIRNSIAIGTAGLGTLGDSAVMAIRTSITDPLVTPDYSLDEVIICCQEHFRFLYGQFKKYNPNLYHPMLFLLGRTDPHSKEPFLYSFESDLNFQKSVNLDWVVRGPLNEENQVRSIIASRVSSLPLIGNAEIDSAMFMEPFAESIKAASINSDSVGSDILGMMVGDFPSKVAHF